MAKVAGQRAAVRKRAAETGHTSTLPFDKKKSVEAKVAEEEPVCGMCGEIIHPKVSICLPKDATLRSDALAAVPGGRHGRPRPRDPLVAFQGFTDSSKCE